MEMLTASWFEVSVFAHGLTRQTPVEMLYWSTSWSTFKVRNELPQRQCSSPESCWTNQTFPCNSTV